MISRLIRNGKVTEIELSKSGNDRFGFPCDTTLISEEHWKNLKDALSLSADVDEVKEAKVTVALKVIKVVKEK